MGTRCAIQYVAVIRILSLVCLFLFHDLSAAPHDLMQDDAYERYTFKKGTSFIGNLWSEMVFITVHAATNTSQGVCCTTQNYTQTLWSLYLSAISRHQISQRRKIRML